MSRPGPTSIDRNALDRLQRAWNRRLFEAGLGSIDSPKARVAAIIERKKKSHTDRKNADRARKRLSGD